MTGFEGSFLFQNDFFFVTGPAERPGSQS
jgi:hypothetical protein